MCTMILYNAKLQFISGIASRSYLFENYLMHLDDVILIIGSIDSEINFT